MSGVVDRHGQQWERCNCCTRWVKYEDLRYAPVHPTFRNPWPEHDKLDLCPNCADGTLRTHPKEYRP